MRPTGTDLALACFGDELPLIELSGRSAATRRQGFSQAFLDFDARHGAEQNRTEKLDHPTYLDHNSRTQHRTKF